jgi:hypothetical protein
MVIVRNVFTAKPGQASRLAKMFKQAMEGVCNIRVLTDMVGTMNTVVMEMEFNSMADYEQMFLGYMAGNMPQATKDAMAGYNELWTKGQREVWKVLD